MDKRIIISVVVALAMALLPGRSCARYLNTATGRFQTMDTYQGDNQDPLSLHKYLYCQADPVDHIEMEPYTPTIARMMPMKIKR